MHARYGELLRVASLALLSGERIEWDSAKLRVTNVAAANRFIGREYRKGWSL
jgi:hypothetical protein